MSTAGMLAALFSLIAAALVVLVMPWWASLAIALALPVVVALGGAALLGQVLVGGGVLAAIYWLARRALRSRQPPEASVEELKLRSTAARPRAAQPSAQQRRAA